MTIVGWALATAALVGGQVEETRSTRECAALFGDENSVEENRAYREAHLNFVLDGDPYVTLVQFHDWDEPARTKLEGIELLDSTSAGARIEVRLGAESCPDGTYLLSVDDAIGENLRVLALLESAVLIDHEGELVYVAVDGQGPIEWEMVWSSRYYLRPSAPKGRASRAKSRARRKPTPKKTPRRKRGK